MTPRCEWPAFNVWGTAKGAEDQFKDGFVDWLDENIHVWNAFEHQALRVWNRGRDHYSARTIIEVLRHESALADNGPDYKLNDHQTPDLARLFMLAHPDCGEFFATRVR